ncbi:MAG: TatD family hydrolase [Clostridia bacterium]|nr:TatD family hydrolase [Clostridia bacterium]
MSGIFDTHAHYCDKRFENEFEGGASALLSAVFANGVDKIINVGTNTAHNLQVIAMASEYEGMYAAVGIHPSDIDDEVSLEDAISKLRVLLDKRAENKVVALGEIGLDYYWRQDNKEEQMKFLEAQLALAEEYSMPVIIHDRDAHGDIFETILRHPNVRGVFHSYSGSPEMARELLRRGWYISFSGVVTFKNARNVKAAAAVVPLDRFLLETDAPYLAPEPWRGKLNRSDYIASSVRTLAEIHGVTEDEIRDYSHRNACKLFSV